MPDHPFHLIAGLLIVGAVILLGSPILQRLIDAAPDPIHRLADWLGACDRHP